MPYDTAGYAAATTKQQAQRQHNEWRGHISALSARPFLILLPRYTATVDAKRVLFGTINVCTGHRIVHRYLNMRQESFQDFLRQLRRRYKGRPIWLLLDDAPCHTAPKSKALAVKLGIELIPLPKQCSELNAMDHLWKQLKAEVSANFQFKNIEQHADYAMDHCLALSNQQARCRAGILSKSFWLKLFVQ
jgi:transposase